jgi:hypothetical protein
MRPIAMVWVAVVGCDGRLRFDEPAVIADNTDLLQLQRIEAHSKFFRRHHGFKR